MNTQRFEYPIFALGFRAFFALAGLFALVLIALWTSIFDGSLKLDNYYPTTVWHAHEMLLGYSVAVISGFLLTAVKNWTGVQTLQNGKLAGLCILWIYGRVVPFYSELLPDTLIAVVDFVFLPILAISLIKPLLSSGHFINLVFVLLLLLMSLGNGLIHAEILGIYDNTLMTGLNLVVGVISMMIITIAGRVFPFFTEKALKGVIAMRNPIFDGLAVVSSLFVFVLLVLDVNGFWLMSFAAVAAISNGLRVFGWYVQRVWYVPLLWVLYLGYGWLILGFILIALYAVELVSASLAIHAFTVGGIGVLTLGMMARVSLGHTGRAIKASNCIAVAFLLINLAALFRVLLPALLPMGFSSFLIISTYLWLAAFSLFVYVYTPILSSPRIDGKAG